MSIFEAIMLICFGFAWPFSIYTSYTTRTAKGKSLFFLVVLLIGYCAGILHKILYAYDYVIFLYILNLCLVSIDILLYLRNRRLDKQRKASSHLGSCP